MKLLHKTLLATGALLAAGCSDPNPPETLPADLAAGKQVVETTCIACHGQGLNGAPILGNPKMWAKRLPQGEDTLVSHAINGYAYDMMPPRGGNPDLSDTQVRNAVRYMMSLVQPET
ncbi:MAG: c-type cytochrome [Pseudomonadota bacterium]|nr:cytochrome c5 family protein [Pseudomonadales bacterium]MDY6918786.1 c-type cytochrome [Pseudomonadota bacterium]